MKLGLIQALDPEKSDIFDYEYPPLGLLYIASYIKKYLNFNKIVLKSEVEDLIKEKPDIIGISSNSFNFKEAIRISEFIKENLSIPLIIGGAHITILPYSLPETIDIGVIGEGEETMKALLEVYIKKGKFTPKNLSKIKGIVYREKGIKKLTIQREPLDPLDMIPPPDRNLNDDTTYTTCIITSRGCPYKCSFCSLSSACQKFRTFSTDYVKKELSSLVKNLEGYPHVRILDDVFALNIKRLKEIKNFILENSIEKQVSFDCSIRADLFTEEICKILKEMNVTRVLLGAESGSDKILKYYRKGQTVQDNQRVIDLCFHYGIELTASFIIGAPVETEEDLLETYNFIKKNSSKFWNVHIDPLDPLPGTEIWNYARNKGLVSDFDEDIKCLKLSEYIKEEKFIECLKAFDYLVSMEVEKHFTLARELMNDVYG